MSLWGWGDDKRLMDWGIVDRHRKQMLRAEAAEDRAEQAERKLAEVTK